MVEVAAARHDHRHVEPVSHLPDPGLLHRGGDAHVQDVRARGVDGLDHHVDIRVFVVAGVPPRHVPVAVQRAGDRDAREWAAPRFPDSEIGAISCRELPVQVLVVGFLRNPVPEC